MRLELQAKQTVAFTSEATEILYGGAAGGGKSHLLRIQAIALCCEIPNLQVYLFRRQYTDLISNHFESETGFPSLLAELIESKAVKIFYKNHDIRFWNGACIHPRHLQHDKDLQNYQGAEIHVLMMDELTHFTNSMYRFLRGRVRVGGLPVPQKYKQKVPFIISGTNPGSVGHNWVKSTFIDAAQPLKIWQTPPEEGGFLRQFIPARLEDNQIMMQNDPNYAHRLSGLGDPALIRAMREGDWNIVAGGALDDVWSPAHCIVEPFDIPKSWEIDRSYDWGESKPWAAVWFAQANGETVIIDGKEVHYPAGSVFIVDELYGWNGKPDEGTRMTITEQAVQIKKIDDHYGKRVKAGPADSMIWDVRNGQKSFAEEFSDAGVRWVKSDKSSGSRVRGLSLMRKMLKATADRNMEEPHLYVFSNCSQVIRTLPTLPRDTRNPDDVDTKAEDHLFDAIKYRLITKRKLPQLATVVGY